MPTRASSAIASASCSATSVPGPTTDVATLTEVFDLYERTSIVDWNHNPAPTQIGEIAGAHGDKVSVNSTDKAVQGQFHQHRSAQTEIETSARGGNATLSVQWQVSEQYVRTWPSTSSITVSSRIRHGTMQLQQRCGYS